MESKHVQERHRGKSRYRGKIFVDLFDSIAFATTREHEEFDDICFAGKRHLGAFVLLHWSIDVDGCFSGIDPQEGSRGIFREAHNVRDRPVDRCHVVRDVQVILGIK